MAKYRKYTLEFKREAVRARLSRGERTVEDVAKSLGVATSLLDEWRAKHGATVKAAPRIGKESAEQLEIRELRRTRTTWLNRMGTSFSLLLALAGLHDHTVWKNIPGRYGHDISIHQHPTHTLISNATSRTEPTG